MSEARSYFRSNFFAVKDLGKFMMWVAHNGLILLEKGELVGVRTEGTGEGDLPEDMDEENEEGLGTYEGFYNELAHHLCDEHVAVLIGVHKQGMEYLNAQAIALNNRGECREINLWDIHELADQIGKHVTECCS